jgi:hypothetical protein
MSLLDKLRRRPRGSDAIARWRSEVEAARGPAGGAATGAVHHAPEAEPAFRHAPDADPEDVVWTGRRGMDGRRLEPQRGGLTGLEGGGSGHTPAPYDRL